MPLNRSWVVLIFVALVAAGCSGGGNADGGDAQDAATDRAMTDTPTDVTDVATGDVVDAQSDTPAGDVTDVPPGDVPGDVPATDVPVTDVPVMDVPITDVPGDVPTTDTPVTDVPSADVVDASDAGPATETYIATLSGAEEVPVVNTAATGTVMMTYTPATRVLNWTITFTGLTPTAAHLHNAAATENGPVAVTLATTSGATGMATLTVAQESELRLGHFYANVHSAMFPGGEIRGQVLRPGELLFVARLSGSEEVPANRSTANGSASVIVNAGGTSIHYRASVSLVPTAAHIHNGIAGTNGGVVYPLTGSGMVYEGNQAVTAANLTDLSATRWYVNFHTATLPGGEIRGQLLRAGSTLFVANLTGAQEVPAVTTTATGNASAVLLYRSTEVQYAFGLSIAPTAAHIHRAIAGQNGAVANALMTGMTGAGMVTLLNTDVDPLRNGGLYVNAHTTANPGGEIRGQLLQPGQVLYVALLSGANEVPAVTSASTGSVAAILSVDGTSLRYDGVITPALAMITGAHIHNAAAGSNGPVVYPLTVTGGAPVGTQPVTATDLMRLDMAGYYVNIHTSANPGGEIRGQLVRR